ncbi:MAG TPA: Ig-like domain-containing protein [Opitutus sp.]|nr:Ig-like domain-containing protein [Opitutus sp.]
MKTVLLSPSKRLGRRLLGGLALGIIGLTSAAFAQVYSENFDDGVADNWTVSSGDWAVSTGTDKTYTNTTTTAGPEIAYYNAVGWTTGYTYEATLHTWGTGWGNQVGMIYQYQDGSNYYEIEFGGANDPSGKNVHLYECVGGTSTEVASGNYTNPTNHLIDVQIVRSGDDTTIKVGGSTVLTRTQTALTGAGKIGVADRYAAGYINDIVVTDTAAPTVSITAPAAGTVSGTVTVSADADDTGGSGLAGVQFKLDGGNLDAEDTSAPYSISWNTTLATSGSHSLTAVARDGAGNSTTSSPVAVTVSNSLPGGWAASDIGSVGATGSTNYSSGTFIIDGSGSNIWDTADSFQFARVSASGDLTIVARVVTQQNTFQWAKAGVMIRETTSAGSKYVLLCVTPNDHVLFEARTSTTSPDNSSIQAAAVSSVGAPQWLRLVRTGNTFHAAYSDDGHTWVTTGMTASSVDVTMGSSVLAGLAVCSCDDGTLGTATFDGVGVRDTGDYKAAFPKLAGVNYGAKNYDSSTYQAELAKLDFVVLGFYKGWTKSSLTIEDAVQDIKALHPGMLVGQYTIQESEYLTTDPSSSEYDINVELNAGGGPGGVGDWWAYDHNGNRTYESSVQPETNITAFTQTDASGLRFPQWLAQRSYNAFFSPVPEFDVWFIDNVFYKPRRDADWDRDGTDDSKDNATVRTYYRQGNVDHVTAIDQLEPGVLVMGNVDGWSSSSDGFLRESQYQGLFSGALQEHALGQSYSEESLTDGWNVMMSSYRSLMDNTIAPHLVIFSADGSATDYATFRYAFASALMEDGYFSFSAVNGTGHVTYSDVSWFDEYDLAGTSTTSWLGAAVDPKQRSPKSSGVYIRRFANGMAIVNPKGNGSQTINLSTLFPGETYKRISGTQDSTTNNGATVTSLTIGARQGLILVKQ